MTTETSRISTDIDFERDGKQTGFLRAPHSRNDSAWGSLLIPVTVVKNGAGPTMLLTGGNHGDEYEGPVALMKLARALDPTNIRGRVIVMPALNLPALRAGQRLSPIDGKNMNRVFPGSRDGTMTEVIAHYVHSALLPLADIVVDIHSGGRSMSLVPCAVIHQLENAEQMRASLAAVEAFGAPLALVLEELDSAGMLDGAVENMGKIFVSTELGGGGMLTPETVAIADTGIRNLLFHFGIFADTRDNPGAGGQASSRLMQVPDADCYVTLPVAGIYEPFVGIGTDIKSGQPLGQIHFVEEPGREPLVVPATRDGTLIGRWIPGQASAGDMAALLAVDYRPR